MGHFTRKPRPRFLLVAAAVLLAAALGSPPPSAQADGDPASDVLASQAVFLPQDASVPPVQQAQIGALLAEAQRAGFSLRVAMIASMADLGSVGELWRQPQDYARFLGQELSLVYRGPLLVVMANGYGLYPAARAPALGPAAGGLGTATLTAIQRLAAASGHPLAAPSPAGAPTRGAGDPVAWAVFAAGLVLIGAAWAASFRAKPLRSRTAGASG